MLHIAMKLSKINSYMNYSVLNTMHHIFLK